MIIHIEKVLLLMWRETCFCLNSHNIIWEIRDPWRKDSDLKNPAGEIWRKWQAVAQVWKHNQTHRLSWSSCHCSLRPAMKPGWPRDRFELRKYPPTTCPRDLCASQLQIPPPAPELPPLPAAHCCQTWFKTATSFPPFPPSWRQGGVPLDFSNSSRHLCLDNKIPSWETQAQFPCCHRTSRDSPDRPSPTTG